MFDRLLDSKSGTPCPEGLIPIWLQIRAPVEFLGMAPGLPFYSPVPVEAFREMFELQLHSDGLDFGATFASGPLHAAIFVFEIEPQHVLPALRSLQRALDKVGLRDLSRADWWDRKELIFRPGWYGSTLKLPAAPFTLATIKEHIRQIETHNLERGQVLQQWKVQHQ